MTLRKRVAVLLSLLAVCVVGAVLVNPIPQDIRYHQFADFQAWLGIPYCGNVFSNLPFFIIGAWGLLFVIRERANRNVFHHSREWWNWAVAFFGIAMIGPGSAYYHLAPDNATLLWDRLPMAAGFMGLYAGVISERVDTQLGLKLLPLLLACGIGTVFYWYLTEQAGAGDLRPYAVVQFFPLITIPVMLHWFPSQYQHAHFLWKLVLWYAIAKVLEYYDLGVYTMTGNLVSGHTLKHLAAAVGCFYLVRYLTERGTLTMAETTLSGTI